MQMDQQHFTKLLCFLSIFKLCIAAQSDHTLSPNQTLVDGQLLISPSKIFELGFSSPPNNTRRFLVIRYRNTPDVFVWLANRETPVTGREGRLTLTNNGSLILTSPHLTTTAIWIPSSDSTASSPTLQLLDSGNLVLTGDKQGTYLWQSFDYPCNTRLPGMTMGVDRAKYLTSWRSADDPFPGEYSYGISNEGLSQIVVAKGKKKTYRTVFWNNEFVGFPNLGDRAWMTEATSRKGRLVSVTNPVDDPGITRITLNPGGTVERYMMNERRDGWTSMLASPRDPCEVYGKCGGNGICKVYMNPICECLKGFRPRAEMEWAVYEWRRGCYRDVPFDCRKEDGFMRLDGIKFPDSVDYQLTSGVSIDECGKQCFSNCNCTAYADPYSDSESNCLMWFGDLVDLREEGGWGDGQGPTIYIRVPASELGPAKGKLKLISVVAASVFGVLILGLLIRARRKRKRNKEASKKVKEETELPLFNLATIVAATNNFSPENLIGEGGFGPVYKGRLSTGEVFAVKRMLRTSRQGHEEFKSEVFLISKLQHRNLVRILGCCSEGDENILIYEYMHNKSLDYFIFDHSRSAALTWPKRFAIIMGIAKGLLYLHHDSRLKIIHRDLKTSNILLDENLNAKISDFGLARMFEGDDDQNIARTETVIGTYGYMAPEYAYQGKFSTKSDIFSLGVVILEIVTGKRNRSYNHPSCLQNLLEQAWVLCKENRELELLDPICNNDTCSRAKSQAKRCIRVGLLCVQNAAEDRPVMPSVFLMLSSEDAELPEPKKPGFYMQSGSRFSNSDTSMNKDCSCSVITITDIEAR